MREVPLTPWPTSVMRRRALGGGELFEDAQVDPPCNVIRGMNSWYGQVAGVKTYLCAGKVMDSQNPAGILLVRVPTTDPDNPYQFDMYYPPPAAGRVAIVAMNGTQVTLQSTSGAQFVFDLATRQWVGQTLTPTAAPPPASPTLAPGAEATLTIASMKATLGVMVATADAVRARIALTQGPLMLTALARPTPRVYPTFPPPPTSGPEPPPPLGLLPDDECVAAYHQFAAKNCWIGVWNNEYVKVYAGLDTLTDGQGEIVVVTRTLTLRGYAVYYPTPARVGSVHTVSASGSRLTLVPDAEQPTPVVFIFDIATRQWVGP